MMEANPLKFNENSSFYLKMNPNFSTAFRCASDASKPFTPNKES